MTRMTTTPLAVSADYADALLAARRAKAWLFLLLLLFLLAQLTIFFLVRFDVLTIGAGDQVTVQKPDMPSVDVDASEGRVEVEVTTQPTDDSPESLDDDDDDATSPTVEGDAAEPAANPPVAAGLAVGGTDVTGRVLAYVVNSIVYLGTIFSILLAVVILLIVLVMLVGRLIGVSHATSAFIWMAFLALLLFPWQLCYGPETAGAGSSSGSAAPSSARAYDPGMNDFRVPGAFYTWDELRRDAKFGHDPLDNAVLKYARFAGFPVLALLILFMVQAKSGRAVKFALGEAEMHVDVATTDT